MQEMNEKQFNNLDYKEWHIGVVSPLSQASYVLYYVDLSCKNMKYTSK